MRSRGGWLDLTGDTDKASGDSLGGSIGGNLQHSPPLPVSWFLNVSAAGKRHIDKNWSRNELKRSKAADF